MYRNIINGQPIFLAMFLLNFCYWLFLKTKFGLQPFGKAHFLIILVSLIAFGAAWAMPIIHNFWADVIIRSIVVGVVYIVLAYFLKISDDVNIEFDKVINKLKK
jgi:fatty acid desaturase